MWWVTDKIEDKIFSPSPELKNLNSIQKKEIMLQISEESYADVVYMGFTTSSTAVKKAFFHVV